MIQREQEVQMEVKHFYETQQKYYNDELDDKELANEVTQPFWQSMRLTKRRIKAKGLRMDIPVCEIPGKRENITFEKIRVCQDGRDIIGKNIRDVITHRSFWRGNKKIYSKKEREICAVHILKANVQEKEAACPNCGHMGKISDYIDGCDYCGSVFTVNDFEAKISGFFLEENVLESVKKMLKRVAFFCGILFVLLILLTALSFLGLVKGAIAGGDDKGLVTNTVAMVFSANMVPVMWDTLIGVVLVNGIAGVLLICLFPKQIIGESIVREIIPEFAAQDFLQNLEYKIRNIHFADSETEVSAFVSCDMKDIVKRYEDVVDCNIRKLRFTDVRQDGEKYYLQAIVHLKLSMYNGRRIRNKHERVQLAVSGKQEVFLKNTLAIREYKCPNCHSSVALLEGGKCAYCGTKLDYENYSWLIDSYRKKIQRINVYQWIKLSFIGIFLMIFMYNVSTADVVDNNVLELYEEVNNAEHALDGFFEAVDTPEELGMDVILETLKKKSSRYRTYYYVVPNGRDAAKLYIEKLKEEGYIYDVERSTEKQYDMYMPVEYQEQKGYIKIRVSFDEGGLFVEMNTVEFIGQ